jgi:hypothetical protein
MMQVAFAIAKADGLNYDAMPPARQAHYNNLACAAIKAMSFPATLPILTAGNLANENQYNVKAEV